ncbi:FAR1 DNA binding domain [Dillenia turbinata]|uniref:FAR1 DNA binding domain n=1 Tax=Dillenia turbinata TaxID=194707 RepID=A0AAN8UN25_9MAGN
MDNIEPHLRDSGHLPVVEIDVKQIKNNVALPSINNHGTDLNPEKEDENPQILVVGKLEEDIDGVRDSQSCKPCSVDTGNVDVDVEHEVQGSEIPSADECKVDVEIEMEGLSPQDGSEAYLEPKLGMEFESEEHAYKCYSRYAVLEGFSIRKDFVNKSRTNGAVVSRRFTCFRQGYRSNKSEGNDKRPRKETRTGCLAHMTISRQPNGKFRVTHFETEHNHEFVTACTAHMLPSQKRLTFARAVEAESCDCSATDGVPKLGMGFESEDHAYEFYNKYAGRVGFSVRKDYVNRSKIDGAVASRRFTCHREGFRQKDKRDLNVKRPRKETRIGCLAQLVIARQLDGVYRVTHFEEKHNHELVSPCRIRMLRSQKRSAESQTPEDNGEDGYNIQVESTSEVMDKEAGKQTNQGYSPIDYERKLQTRRMREMKEGEAEAIQNYLQGKQLKNRSFFHAIQVDVDGQMSNFLWIDPKMAVDYSDFGDVVCFDTTYTLNGDCRPFAYFIGVNHHKQMVIFGAAFLYDETVESFKWIFCTFIEAMSGKKPRTILTNQDSNISEAISSVMPETQHRICVWHVYQNAVKQLSHIFGCVGSFANDFSRCIFHHEEEEDFMNAWKEMLDAYGLWENVWLNEIFKEREKWAIAYGRNIFCADMLSAQFCEGFDSNLRKYLMCEVNVLQFYKQFGKLLTDWHYKELEANFDMNQNMPNLMGDVIMLKHARDAYTPKIFELFQQEFEKCLNIVINHCAENGSLYEYKVSTYGRLQEYLVTFDSSDYTVVCCCKKYEFVGILCCHALKVLDYRNIKVVPTQYILKRLLPCSVPLQTALLLYQKCEQNAMSRQTTYSIERKCHFEPTVLLPDGDGSGPVFTCSNGKKLVEMKQKEKEESACTECFFFWVFSPSPKLATLYLMSPLLPEISTNITTKKPKMKNAQRATTQSFKWPTFWPVMEGFTDSCETFAGSVSLSRAFLSLGSTIEGSGGSGNVAQHLFTMSMFLHFALSKLQFPTPQKSKSSEIIYMHNDYSTNLVTCIRMASMKFCKLIVTSDKKCPMILITTIPTQVQRIRLRKTNEIKNAEHINMNKIA